MALIDTLVKELVGPKSVGELCKSTGASSEQAQNLVKSALPILLSGMMQNASTKEGAQSLDKALNDHAPAAEKSTSSMLSKADAKDGQKIISHILGDKEKEVTKGLSKSTGLSQSQVSTMMSLLAPVVLSLVGNHKNEESQAQSSVSGLAGLLSAALSGSSGQTEQQGGVLNLGGLLMGLLK